MSDTEPDTASASVLEALYAVIESRKSADPSESYTARLLAEGLPKVAQKVGEEATETVVAALAQPRQALIAESADLLYHLLTLWAARGVRPGEVFAELAKRRK
tara:strand:+ start:639 stop:947 length:309 start_codon:yes stop_codon:yes gene_type:complete